MTEWLFYAVLDGAEPADWCPYDLSITRLNETVKQWPDEGRPENDEAKVKLSLLYDPIPPEEPAQAKRICGIIFDVDAPDIDDRLARFSDTCAEIKRSTPTYIEALGLTVIIVGDGSDMKVISRVTEEVYKTARTVLGLSNTGVNLHTPSSQHSLDDLLRGGLRVARMKDKLAQLMQ